MEWKGALRNAESRLNVLKFNQREELEVLQLTCRQWRRNVDRYSIELALRRIRHLKLDLDFCGATFDFGETDDPKKSFYTSDVVSNSEDFDDEEVDYDSVEFDAIVANDVRATMKTSKCTRLNHCFIEWLRLLIEDGSPRGVVGTDFGMRFWVWVKALEQLEADVHVQTLEAVDPYYNMDMGNVYRTLHRAFHVQEYVISKENTDMGEDDRGDELCVDVVKKAKRVSVHEYYLNDGDDDDEVEVEADEHDDNVNVDDKPELNGSMKNVLDFVFSAPECEELYVSVEGDGSGLINKLVRRFRGLRSTSQMVFTFTWQWGINYEGGDWVKGNDCPKPIAEGHANPFRDVTLEHRRRQLDPPVLDVVTVGQLSGDVYEFRNEHDGTYMTVVISKELETAQFRKGRFVLADAAVDGSPDKKRRLSDNDEE